MLDRAELDAWLRLILAPGIGRGSARRLLTSFGSPERVLDASLAALTEVVGRSAAAALREAPADHVERVAATLAWHSGGPNRTVVSLGDPHYPPSLLQTPDPPLLLFVQGDPAHLLADAVAVVGSRTPTPQGADNARQFGCALARHQLLVVSGLALGIDGAAHEGALSAPGPTIAVVGTGLDIVYPARHHDLAHRISSHGALISEFVPGTPPLKENFPLRNRIIAGMSLGTLVVEAALRSGSLITARLAAEYGREVFAVPGSIHATQSKGCHLLIRDGAKLVESASDVLEELRRSAPLAAQVVATTATATASAPGDIVLQALGHDPATLDSLLERTGMPTAELLARLLQLELDGLVARLPGGLYQRRSNA